jgi:hypothetical protein
LLEFIPSSNPRRYIWIDLHICVVACKIFGCRWFLHHIRKFWFIYFLQIQVFHNLFYSPLACWLIRHKCQGDPDPRVIWSAMSGHPVPDPLLSFCRILKWSYSPPLGITSPFSLKKAKEALLKILRKWGFEQWAQTIRDLRLDHDLRPDSPWSTRLWGHGDCSAD